MRPVCGFRVSVLKAEYANTDLAAVYFMTFARKFRWPSKIIVLYLRHRILELHRTLLSFLSSVLSHCYVVLRTKSLLEILLRHKPLDSLCVLPHGACRTMYLQNTPRFTFSRLFLVVECKPI